MTVWTFQAKTQNLLACFRVVPHARRLRLLLVTTERAAWMALCREVDWVPSVVEPDAVGAVTLLLAAGLLRRYE